MTGACCGTVVRTTYRRRRRHGTRADWQGVSDDVPRVQHRDDPLVLLLPPVAAESVPMSVPGRGSTVAGICACRCAVIATCRDGGRMRREMLGLRETTRQRIGLRGGSVGIARASGSRGRCAIVLHRSMCIGRRSRGCTLGKLGSIVCWRHSWWLRCLLSRRRDLVTLLLLLRRWRGLGSICVLDIDLTRPGLGGPVDTSWDGKDTEDRIHVDCRQIGDICVGEVGGEVQLARLAGCAVRAGWLAVHKGRVCLLDETLCGTCTR